jgi:hypothetical protein
VTDQIAAAHRYVILLRGMVRREILSDSLHTGLLGFWRPKLLAGDDDLRGIDRLVEE